MNSGVTEVNFVILQSIGDEAFRGCTGLTSIWRWGSVPPKLTSIGFGAFEAQASEASSRGN